MPTQPHKNQPTTTPISTSRKAISYIVIASIINSLLLPAHTAMANERIQQQAIAQNTQQTKHNQPIDNAFDEIARLSKHYSFNKDSLNEQNQERKADLNIITRGYHTLKEVFFDSPEQQQIQSFASTTHSKILALRQQLDNEQTSLMAELAKDKQQLVDKGFSGEVLTDHDKDVAEISNRYQRLNKLFDEIARANNDSDKKQALDNLSKQINEWQPDEQIDDVKNLPWGTPNNDVSKPINSDSKQSTPKKMSYQQLKNTAIGQWRQATTNRENYAVNRSPIDNNHYSGMSSTGNWQVLKALSKEVKKADLAETESVQITQEIKDLAQQLDHNPAKIYAWVYNNIEFVPTYGSLQGSAYTLETKRGNSTDTASLLIALLRASNIPARYVVGKVNIPAKFAMKWVGGVDNINAVSSLLGQGGIPRTTLTEGGTAKYIQIEHVWVEANIDWIGHRGNISADKSTNNQKQWIPLDATYKTHVKTKDIDLSKATNFNADTFIDSLKQGAKIDEKLGSVQYLNQEALETTTDNHQQQISNYLAKNYPDATTDDLLGKGKIIAWDDEGIAPILPYKVDTVIADYHELPDNMKHYFVLTYYENVGVRGDYSEALPWITKKIATSQLRGKPLALSFRPEDKQDEKLLLETMKGESMSSRVWMVPELTLDGKVVKVDDEEAKKDGSRFRLGFDMMFGYGFQAPNRSSPITTLKKIVVGEYNAIGYNLQGISQQQLERTKTQLQNTKDKIEQYENGADISVLDNLTRHDTTGAMLQATIQQYFAVNDLQNKIHSRVANVVQNNYVSFGTYSTKLVTYTQFGLPYYTQPNGMGMDISRISSQIVAKDNDRSKQRAYLKIQSARNSANENLVPEQLFDDTEGVSAVKIIKIASEEGQPIYTINKKNIDKVLPLLKGHSPRTMRHIKRAVKVGQVVTISESPVEVYGIKDSGYIIENPRTGGSAYVIGGGFNGGLIKKVCRNNLKLALKGLLKPKNISGMIAGVMFTAFLTNLLDSVTQLSDCHEKLLIRTLAVLDGIILAHSALSMLRYTAVGGILMTATLPIMMYPAVVMATTGMQRCEANVSPFSVNPRSKKKGDGTCMFKTITRFRSTGIKGSRIVINKTTGATWFVPARYKKDTKIPKLDPIGEKLQILVNQKNSEWKQNPKLTLGEKEAIDKAIEERKYWLANLLKKQAKGRWIQTKVKDEADSMIELRHLQWNFQKGIDVEDPKTNIKYDILSGTPTNIRIHVKRMNSFIWRLLKF